ncbi:MAG: hypothetical protein MK226_20060 [Saprospiraceae bacterium]|nr:hypothetical protein [Saprospiraceae bacterium]
MNIVTIIKESLYAVQYDKDKIYESEFEKVIDSWQDAIFLEEFFELHKDDLYSGFWGDISIEDAILRTREEAIKLEEKIIDIAEIGKTDRFQTLSTLFQPLYNNPTKTEPFEKNKVKGHHQPSWLRIYALRIDQNCFLITGGAIKLTPNMNERDHLLQELEKLKMVKNYICDEDNFDDADFFEMI